MTESPFSLIVGGGSGSCLGTGAPNAEKARSRAAGVVARLGLRVSLYSLPACRRACQKRRLRVPGLPGAVEPVYGCRQLAQTLDGGVRHVVTGMAAAEVNDPHVCQPCPLNVEPGVVAPVHGVLGGYPEKPEGLTEDTGSRLAHAALVREDNACERVEDAFVLEDPPQHGAGRSERV